MISIGLISGSSRNGSLHFRMQLNLIKILKSLHIKHSVFDLAELNLPIFSQDIEFDKLNWSSQIRLQEFINSHDGLLLLSPEYNGSVSPLLKNALDWASRKNERFEKSVFEKKTVALAACSPGALGGLRGLRHLREIMTTLGCIVIPQQVCIANASAKLDQFNESFDSLDNSKLSNLVIQLLELTEAVSQITLQPS